jgi:hypothetical protein
MKLGIKSKLFDTKKIRELAIESGGWNVPK